jgi:predicted nucleic acid-binding protein
MASKSNAPVLPVIFDSSCWLEVFDGGTRAALFEKQAANVESMIVPVITLYEVFKYLSRKFNADSATRAITYMQRGLVVDMDSALILDAASNGLPLADSLIYATAQLHHAELWTQDAHFEGLAGVKYFSKGAND